MSVKAYFEFHRFQLALVKKGQRVFYWIQESLSNVVVLDFLVMAGYQLE